MYKTENKPFEQLEIGLASPKEIRSWAERFLPNGETIGEVTSWETVNYKTLKPEPNGLFCQKIFGPVTDYTCACGKKAINMARGFCPKCGVERTTSQVRRYRMGYIRLKQPVAHTLYSSQKPSPLGLCLDWPNKRLQAILYGTEFCHLPDNFEYFQPGHTFVTKIENVLNLQNSIQPSEKTRSNEKLVMVPRLMQNLSQNKQSSPPETHRIFQKLYGKQKLKFGIHVYGVGYDMTWRQVEDLQDFLIYMWEQPKTHDVSIPYYNQTSVIPSDSRRAIPDHAQYYPVQAGGFVFQRILAHLDLVGIQQQLALDLEEIKITFGTLDQARRAVSDSDRLKNIKSEITRLKTLEKKQFRRLVYFRDFYKTRMQPAWMMLSYLPVLPPGLRPITSIRGELVVSDLNSLYRKVLTRNRRLTNNNQFGIFDSALSGSWAAWCYNLRQVQEAVDGLLKTGQIESGKTTKSLLEALKGKRGRFRQHLLGKRVDYSGRSVIVVGPKLKVHECGLPKQMAVELFQPFLIQQLRNKGIAFTTTGAKAIIVERQPIIWTLLREILQSHPVLLNRAPTLHRLGIQAFIPKLVEGKAILLHPLVCPSFNADFDGDQMAVHIPLTSAARAEAFNLLLSRNHLLAPSSGQPMLLPTQDMVLGCYYLTLSKEMNQNLSFKKIASVSDEKQLHLSNMWYASFAEILEDYERQKITTHTPVWVIWEGKVQNFLSEQQSRVKDNPLEIRLDVVGNEEFFASERYTVQTSKFFLELPYQPLSVTQSQNNNECLGTSLGRPLRGERKMTSIRTTPGRVLLYKLFTTSAGYIMS